MSRNEFGDLSLDEMFPDLDAGPDLPDSVGDFGSGILHTMPAVKFTNTHLVAVFTEYRCLGCGGTTHAPQGYSLKVVHHSRNECVEYRAIASGDLPLYKDLPRTVLNYPHDCLFCAHCLPAEYYE